MNKPAKALVGLVLLFVVHLPSLFYSALLLSYAAVFNNHPTLTANPQEHVNRAKAILKRGRLSELLYAAIELRFAAERMARRDLMLTDMASNHVLKEHDPSKNLDNLHRLAPESAFTQEIYLVKKQTGERVPFGEYRPLDRKRVAVITGRLGDILHPKDGLNPGIASDPWYSETVRFLNETADYLASVYKNNTSFFAFEGLENVEMVRAESTLPSLPEHER